MYSQNVFINLQGESLKEQNIRLSCIDDRISLIEKTLKSFKADENTTFVSINITLEEIKEVALKVGIREFHFIAVPGNTYYINVLPYKVDDFSFAMKQILPVEFSMQHNDNTNNQIEDIDTCLNNFIEENFRMLQLRDSISITKLNKLQHDLSLKYASNEYVSNYLKYEFASLKYALYIVNREKIQQNLFQSSAILYDNIGYMDCFNTVFSHYFSKGYKFISKEDIEKWLDANNYSAFNDALGRDSILKNEMVREMVFLQGMKDAFLDGVFARSQIFKILDKFEKQTKFSQHKKIAANLKKYLSARDFHGKELPSMLLKNIEGNEILLQKYMNKPLIVCLMQTDCTTCLKELETIHYYYDSIKTNCNVVAISFDKSFEKMYNFVKNSKTGVKYEFPFLYFNYNWDIVEEFKLHFFPTFVLINPDGKIAQNPFASPSIGSLKKFMNKK
ncbi:MAG: TlpA family protein disulfide reductase [Bacteroidales bacterium]